MDLFFDLTCWEYIISVDTQVLYFINTIIINKYLDNYYCSV